MVESKAWNVAVTDAQRSDYVRICPDHTEPYGPLTSKS